MEANNMNPVQTPLRLREQSDLGPYCLQYRPPKVHKLIKFMTGSFCLI